MRTAGGSWRFAEEDAQVLEVALYVRDRAGLLVTGDDDVPPPLELRPPGAGLPDEWQRVAGGEQWLAWWRALVAGEQAARAARAGAPPRERMAASRAVYDSLFDPPQFASLSHAPVLRGFALAFGDDGIGASNARPRPGGEFAWETVRDCAEQAAAERRVPLDAIDATVSVLPVHGHWWCVTGPATGLCSTAVARDDGAARAYLHALFGAR